MKEDKQHNYFVGLTEKIVSLYKTTSDKDEELKKIDLMLC